MADSIFPKMLERPEMLCKLYSPETEATDSGLELMVKCSCLEIVGFCLMKSEV